MDEPAAVLVCDDEEGMREGMRRVLERRGFSVVTAADTPTNRVSAPTTSTSEVRRIAGR